MKTLAFDEKSGLKGEKCKRNPQNKIGNNAITHVNTLDKIYIKDDNLLEYNK